MKQVLPSADVERKSRGDAYSDVVQFVDRRSAELGGDFDPTLLQERIRTLLGGESGGLNKPLTGKEAEDVQNVLLKSFREAYLKKNISFEQDEFRSETAELLPVDNNLLDTLKQQVFNVLKELGNNVRDAGVVTLGILLFIGIALLNTVESALNAVWRVTSDQSVISKIISFWAVISLGPLLIAIRSTGTPLWSGDRSRQLFYSGLLPLLNFLVPIGAIWLP